MRNIAVIYGSSTGNTKNVATKIAKKLSAENVLLKDVSSVDFNELAKYPNIILGTSTWGLGDLQDDWNDRLPELEEIDLEGKTLAFFGLGDSSSYPDTFSDGMGLLFETLEGKIFDLAGKIPVEGYNFDSSKAVREGKFIGLALDEDNESNLTDKRLDAWIAEIIPALK
jgi:flavodoxin I